MPQIKWTQSYLCKPNILESLNLVTFVSSKWKKQEEDGVDKFSLDRFARNKTKFAVVFVMFLLDLIKLYKLSTMILWLQLCRYTVSCYAHSCVPCIWLKDSTAVYVNSAFKFLHSEKALNLLKLGYSNDIELNYLLCISASFMLTGNCFGLLVFYWNVLWE